MDGYIYKPPPPPPAPAPSTCIARSGGAPRTSRPYWVAGQPGSKRAEPEPSGFVPGMIPGLNISVSTPQEIEQWILDRKRNWPSKRRVLEKEQQALDQRLRASTGKTAPPGDAKCKFFSKGTCRNGAKCTFAHVRSPKYRRFEPPEPNSSLFKLLVQNDMDKENERVLDLIVLLASRGCL